MSFITSKSAKIFAGVVGFAIALVFVAHATPVKAFSMNLTVGSSGADVTALQSWLIGKGFSISAGATGYFGGQTKAALAAFQSANGISPAAGYFGPLTMAKVNAMGSSSMGGSTVTPGCSAGAMFNSMTGASCTSTTVVAGCSAGAMFNSMTGASCSSTSVSTNGAEGTLTVTTAPVSTGSVYEGDSMVSVLGFKAKAQNSNITLQRVKLNLGTLTTIYNKIYQKVYIVDESGSVITSSDLNSTTVVKDGSNYYITLAGFSYPVAKDTTKTLYVKMDVRANIDSADIDTETFAISFANDGVRGLDGAGIDQYSPTTGSDISKTFSISTNLVDSASLTLSTGASTPLTQEVVASGGSNNNEKDRVTLLTFDIKADKDTVLLTDLVATVTRSAGAATASTTYLYVGDTQVGSASLSVATATFSDIDVTIPKDTTKTFSLRADLRSASSVQTTIVASIATSGLTAENSNGDTVTKTGSATGNNMLVRSDGPIFTLVSRSITYTAAAGITGATSTAKATFVINALAKGNEIYFGTQAASSTFSMGTYKGSVLTTLLNASSTSYTIPSAGVVTAGMTGANAFKISENGNADISVDFIFEGRTVAGALLAVDAYAVGLENIKWSLTGNDTNTSSFMAEKTEWRTSTVVMP